MKEQSADEQLHHATLLPPSPVRTHWNQSQPLHGQRTRAGGRDEAITASERDHVAAAGERPVDSGGIMC